MIAATRDGQHLTRRKQPADQRTARITFHAGPTLFATFGSVSGAGALLGALTAASRRLAGAALIGPPSRCALGTSAS